jgi:hypothetical protein
MYRAKRFPLICSAADSVIAGRTAHLRHCKKFFEFVTSESKGLGKSFTMRTCWTENSGAKKDSGR